jgi:hypothetical protein
MTEFCLRLCASTWSGVGGPRGSSPPSGIRPLRHAPVRLARFARGMSGRPPSIPPRRLSKSRMRQRHGSSRNNCLPTAPKRTYSLILFISSMTVESWRVSGKDSTSLKSKKRSGRSGQSGSCAKSLKMIDDVVQGHKPNALGPNDSLIAVDFVSYRHDSILPIVRNS